MFLMNHKFSASLLFYVLGIVFWLLSLNFAESTLLCVFYSFFVGVVWGLVPRVSGSEPLTWKYLLPPFLLVVLMMFSVKMKLVMSTEVVLFTAMSLIHLRASILSFARLTRNGGVFSWIQLASFIYCLVYLFQKNILPFNVARSTFLVSIIVVSVCSIGVLFTLKRKSDEIKSEAISS